MNTLPLFKSHYSIGRSILTLEEAEKIKSDSPVSIFSLVKEANLQEVVLVEDSFSGFLEAYTNCQKLDIKLIFGIRVTICEDLHRKSEDELNKQHKVVIFAKNTNGYKTLIKLSTVANLEGLYYEPRLDFKYLKTIWENDNLQLAIPFYDSFIFYNVLLGKQCVPDFSFTKPVFFIESNLLPFDGVLNKAIKVYVKNNFETVFTKTIYYASRKDFLAYLTFRCITNRGNSKSTLDEPNLEHLSSAEFCFEAWKECNE